MKIFAAALAVICFGTLANAANLSIDLTGAVPTYTTDGPGGSWVIPAAAGTVSGPTFTGEFTVPFNSSPVTGTNTVYVDSTVTGDELYTLVFTYSPTGVDNNENFDVGVTKDPGTTKPPAGSDDVLATGGSVGIPLPGGPAGISVEEVADSPAVTPEPVTSALIGLGLVVLALNRRYILKRSM